MKLQFESEALIEKPVTGLAPASCQYMSLQRPMGNKLAFEISVLQECAI